MGQNVGSNQDEICERAVGRVIPNPFAIEEDGAVGIGRARQQ